MVPNLEKKTCLFRCSQGFNLGGCSLRPFASIFFSGPLNLEFQKINQQEVDLNKNHPPSSSLKPTQKENTRVCISNSNALEFARRNFWIIFGEDWRNLLGRQIILEPQPIRLWASSHLSIYYTLPETNIAPKKSMVGRWNSLLGLPIFRGGKCEVLVSGMVFHRCSWFSGICTKE